MSEKTFVGLLSRLVTAEEFRSVHDELIALLNNYYIYSWEENSSFCCQLIKHHAKLQGYLFRLLKLSTEEGSGKEGHESLQNELLPWLCHGFVCSADNDEETSNFRKEYESRFGQLEGQLKDAEEEIASLQMQLQQAAMVIEKRNQELYKLQENDVKLKLENSDLCARLTKRISSPEPVLSKRSSQSILNSQPDNGGREGLDVRLNGLTPGSGNTSSPEMDTDHVGKLVKRFCDIYNDDRVVLMESLEGLNDRDTNERLVFNIVESCFFIAKQEQRKMKTRMTQALQPSSGDAMDEDRVKEIVDNFMKKNTENFNSGTLLSDVFNSVRRKYSSLSTISLSENLLSEFTRVMLSVIWSMVAMDPPVTMANPHDGDIIRESRYRRSYMSEFSSTIIHHYIWPCLLREGRVLKRGEVVTRRIPVYNDKLGSRKSPLRPQSAEPSVASFKFKEDSFGSRSWGDYGLGDKKLSLSWNGSI